MRRYRVTWKRFDEDNRRRRYFPNYDRAEEYALDLWRIPQISRIDVIDRRGNITMKTYTT